jgi:hypothetical protein
VTREEHIQQVLKEFPDWIASQHRGATRLVGMLVIESSTGDLTSFRLKVTIPKRFPAQDAHPSAQILDHDLGVTLTEAAHVNTVGEMCVQMEERNEIDYARDGLLRFVHQVVIHLHRIRIWVLTRKYPGPEYAHFDQGVREYQADLPSLRARFDRVAEALPQTLRRFSSSRVQLPRENGQCPCGSGDPFRVCHRSQVLEVRKRMAELGPEPRPVTRRRSRVPIDLVRFLRSRR